MLNRILVKLFIGLAIACSFVGEVLAEDPADDGRATGFASANDDLQFATPACADGQCFVTYTTHRSDRSYSRGPIRRTVRWFREHKPVRRAIGNVLERKPLRRAVGAVARVVTGRSRHR